MKAHADHARATLEALPGYPALRRRIAELDEAVEARVGEVRRTPGGPAPEETERAVAAAMTSLDGDRHWAATAKERLAAGEMRLRQRSRAL